MLYLWLLLHKNHEVTFSCSLWKTIFLAFTNRVYSLLMLSRRPRVCSVHWAQGQGECPKVMKQGWGDLEIPRDCTWVGHMPSLCTLFQIPKHFYDFLSKEVFSE